METTKKTQVVGIKNAGIVIICCLVIAVCIFQFLLGNPSNFMNNDPNNHPLNMLGTIYKGGVVVPLIQTLLLTVIALSVERWFALSKAKGKGNITRFVVNIKEALSENNIAKARELCNKQKGSVANVVYAALEKYDEMEKDNELSKEQKEQVEKKLLETTNYVSFEMHYEVDTALIGGMVIRMGDRVVDSSIRTKLYNLSKELYHIPIGMVESGQ